MILYGGKFVQKCIVAWWCLIRLGFGVELGMLETVNEVLNNFNVPLKITIMTCWDVETKVKFVRFMNDDPPNFEVKFLTQNSNITEATFDRHEEVVVIDLDCEVNPISKINRQMFNYYKIISLFGSLNSSDCSKIYLKMETLTQDAAVLPGSQFFIICRDFRKNNFAVKQVYRIGLNEPFIVEDYATYNRSRYEITTQLTPVLRRRNFHGFQLKAAMVLLNNNSINHLNDYRDIHIDTESKLSYQLTKQLISFVNGTVNISIVPSWGYKNMSTGQWTGMIGQVLRNEADICATGLFFTTERISRVEYIARTSTASSSFIFLSPKLSYTNNLYVLPFDPLLWLCLLILVLVLTLCLVVAVIFELKSFAHSGKRCTLSDVPIIIFGALCQQGSNVTPNSITGRMIMILSFTTLMFLFVSYSANIVALLQSPSNQIRTLHDLYDTKLEFSILDTVYNRHYFASEKEPFRKRFYEEKMLDKDGKIKFTTLEDGIKKVRKGQYAFFAENSGAYKLVSETFKDIEKCGLRTMNFFQMKLNPWYSIQKNSSYKEILKVGMMRIHEHGLKQRENLRYYLTKPKCSGGGASFVSANLVDTGPAIIILLWGFGITLTIFVVELIVKHLTPLREKLLTFKRRIANENTSTIFTH